MLWQLELAKYTMLDTIQPQHFSTFSMKELRRELDSVGADYSNCIEKSELIDVLVNNLNKLNNTNKVSCSCV